MNVPPPEAPDALLVPSTDATGAGAEPDIRFYDNQVPAFVEAELERLYQCLMTTVARFDAYKAAPNASTYVVREQGQVTALFLFRRERYHVTVYNEQLAIPPAQINRFADAVFARYPSVWLISFYAIDTNAGAIAYPLQRVECLEDIRLALPASADDYLSKLGKNTRAGIRYAHRQLLRDFPSFRFEFYSKGEVNERQLRQVIAFNQARMHAKGQTSTYDDGGIEQLFQLVRQYGLVGVATIESRVCAGAICCRVGSHYHLCVLAHDSRYNLYQLGKLCCYFSIADAIERGCTHYHFGWGRFDYKFKMLGQLKALHRIELYRSRPRMLQNARRTVQISVAAGKRKLKQRIADAELGRERSDRWIRSAAKLARAARRLLRRRPRR
ncbi:MAG: GNAT family N-acetyltransferase [Massilia sp.]